MSIVDDFKNEKPEEFGLKQFYISFIREAEKGLYFTENEHYTPNNEALNELNSGCYELVTLFEAALIIALRIDRKNHPIALRLDASLQFDDKTFLDDISPYYTALEFVPNIVTGLYKNQLDPRHPLTEIPYSKTVATPKNVYGVIVLNRDVPDFSWLVTPKEAAHFAVNHLGYRKDMFNDLLTDAKQSNSEDNADKTDQKEDETPKADNIQKTEPKYSNSDKRLKSEKQIAAILEAIEHFGFDASAIPDGGKKKIQRYCESNFKAVFDKDGSFDTAWKKRPDHVNMENYASYAKRSN